MSKYLTYVILISIVTSSSGCSFIKEHFFKTSNVQTQDQAPQEEQNKPMSEPISVNPNHS